MKQFDLQGNEYDIQIRDMIEPIENWQYVSGTRDIGKSYFQNLLNEKDKEIERLNNIINELEKWLWEQRYEHQGEYMYTGKRKVEDVFTMFLEKLQELKGDSSNE